MNELAVFKNIPMNTASIASLYPDVMSAARKVTNLEKAGRIIRLKRGLYVVSPQESGCLLSLNLIGNVLYGPSYVSRLAALREFKAALNQRLATTNIEDVKRDVLPFLQSNPRELDAWSNDYFLQLADRITFV